MGETRSVEAMSALEWYDGIVSGFIRLSGENFLCVMLAFDPETARRRYVLVPLAPGAFPDIALDDLGDCFQKALHRALATNLDIHLSTDEPMAGDHINIESMDPKRLALVGVLRFPRIDDAILPSAQTEWL